MKRKIIKRAISYGVMLGVLLMSIMAAPLTAKAATDVTIYWNDVKQGIDGFGVSQAGWSDGLYNLQEPARSQVMDLLFSQQNGIGVSIFRGAIFPQYCPAPGTYDFTTPRPDQVWIMQQAKARGVDKIIATTWSPPAWMKTNNQTTNGGYLKDDCYDDYADMLGEFVKAYKQNFDIDLYAVSMSNEPNSMTFLSWDSCEWDAAGIKNFLGNYLKPAFQNKGITATKVIAAEPSWWSEDMMTDALNDATACSRLDIVGAHNYPVPVINTPLATNPFTTARAKNKNVWMTEVCSTGAYDPGMGSGMKWARCIHDFMTKAEVNAWFYWVGAIPGNNDEGLINLDTANNTYTMTKRYYTFGQFSKFIKPGYVRINAAANPVSGVYLSAYKDPATGKFAIVAINDSDSTKEVNLVPDGFTTGSLTPYVTNDSLNMAQDHNLALVNGKFQTVLAPRSVTTFVSQNGAPADPAELTLSDDLNNWTATYSHTSGLVLDSSNSSRFNGDTSRVKRMDTTTQSFVYQLNGITDFTATVYHNGEWNGVAFYTSTDNQTWTPVVHVSTPGTYTSGGWYRKLYTPMALFPAGTQYLKVELSGAGAWEKQVAKMVINHN